MLMPLMPRAIMLALVDEDDDLLGTHVSIPVAKMVLIRRSIERVKDILAYYGSSALRLHDPDTSNDASQRSLLVCRDFCLPALQQIRAHSSRYRAMKSSAEDTWKYVRC